MSSAPDLTSVSISWNHGADILFFIALLIGAPVLLVVLPVVCILSMLSKTFSQYWCLLFVHVIYMPIVDVIFGRPKRAIISAGCSGKVLDFGCGRLPWVKYYMNVPAVTEVVALEPNPACHAAIKSQFKVYPNMKFNLETRLIQDLPSDSYDTVVLGMVLCEVPDQEEIVENVYRVLKPGGAMVFWEHVAEPKGTLYRSFQDFFQPFWFYISDGCHCTRDTLPILKGQPWTQFGNRGYVFPFFACPWIRKLEMGVAIK